MAKAALKTKKTVASVTQFLNSITDEQKRKDAKALDKLFREVTGKKPAMWGDSIVGYGTWHYKYASGREGDWMETGFSPRAQALTLYIMPGYEDMSDLLAKLGPHKKGKSCLYIKRLNDVHVPTLKKIIQHGIATLRKKHT